MDYRDRTKLIAMLLLGLLAGVAHADGQQDQNLEFTLEPLRDPFWPVGYFPEDWKSGKGGDFSASSAAPVDSDWTVPESLIQVTATSRMGNKAAAIINGQIKEEGDVIEMIHNNRIYSWKLRKVNSNGTIGLDRLEVNNRTLGFQPGDKR